MTANQDEKTNELTYKTALEILTYFHIVLKLIMIYEPNNVGFVERLRNFGVALHEGFQTETEIRIHIRQDVFFINKIRLKFNVTNFFVYKSILEEFFSRQIGTVTFSAGVDEDELGRFVAFLARRDKSRGYGFERLAEDFESASCPKIRMEKMPEEQHADVSEKSAIPIYILGVYHLKELFESEKRTMHLQLTRRWIQSLVNHLISHESFLIGLTNTKNFLEYTLNHSVNVCILSLALGRHLGLSRHDLIELGISACLHDVGKFEIPNEVLDKPGKLTSEEREVMERHSHFGAGKLAGRRIKEDIPLAAIQVALEHHIKPAMGGYPKYRRRTQVSLFSKIVKVVDYYDAITTKRVYRPKTFTPDEALRLMQKNCEDEFDPLIFKAFALMMGVYPVGTLAALDSGEVGVVIENNPLPFLTVRPLLKLIADTGGRKYNGPVVDLGETDPRTKTFRRTIVKTLDAEKYHIRTVDVLMARVH
jgi:HD-GYP domain-containing protein (c-di-GMP phosphodiesterase class II)